MFNRNNYSVPNPFSSQRPDGRPPPREGYVNPNQQYQGRTVEPPSHARNPSYGDTRQQAQPQRGGRTWELRPAKSPADIYTFGNLTAVSPIDFPPPPDGSDIYLLLNNSFVLSARPYNNFPQGSLSLSDPQRSWMQITLMDTVSVQIYNPFTEGDNRYVGSLSVEVGFAGRKSTETPYDQDELSDYFIRLYQNQILAPGQKVLMDNRSIPMLFTVKSVQLVDLTAEKPQSSTSAVSSSPQSRGILTSQTLITFFKDAKSNINLKASSRRPAANSIIQPDFKFEDMGIGGLDNEFAQIFRRAFASRVFPPGIIEKMGIQHVKGVLLYGPPGTGKTLIARQIGKMLNAREPKVINGPEVLNKYVGQSEENIRKLFADAEKEYKEKGDESGLHIIIFDELDAVCKQRGSGAGGGTGVGDSVVNQLLSKLDGVDQLNNILLIGMTNRKDMIDDALLRPGRLETHVEISLPDEAGLYQIIKIHTAKSRKNDLIDDDVDLEELAHVTKNFSGAEIGGLVKSAASYAFQRHVKVGTMAAVDESVVNLKVNRSDFFKAFDEVKPAFGVSEEELAASLRGGIMHYSPFIQNILDEGRLFVDQVRDSSKLPLASVVLHGPPRSGKTALAAQIATSSEFPLIKLIRPESMVGFGDMEKVNYLNRIFNETYKAPLNIVILDNIENIIDLVPLGPRFSVSVLQALKVLIHKEPPNGRRLLIIGTTSERSLLMQLGLFQEFDAEVQVPSVRTYEELGHILQELQAFNGQDIRRAIDEIRQYTRSEELGIGVKQILSAVERAQQDKEDKIGRFAGIISQVMANRL